MFEKLLIKSFLYPSLRQSPVKEDLNDQFAFRPTGSTTSALAALLSKITEHLESNSYVRVFSLDFSKAFDSVRHAELCIKLANLSIQDNVYNWIVSYLNNRHHCTKVMGSLSAPKEINASVVQGSAIGPVSYIITASDLKPCSNSNNLFKYADDSYLLVPSENEDTIGTELKNIEDWASRNNLKLNRKKSLEMIVTKKKLIEQPQQVTGIERVSSLDVLGVTIQSDLRMDAHIDKVVKRASSDLYALKILRYHILLITFYVITACLSSPLASSVEQP